MVKKRDVEGMGTPEIKYGESMCFVQHISTGLWLTYASVDAKSARLGPLKRKVRSNRVARCLKTPELKDRKNNNKGKAKR